MADKTYSAQELIEKSQALSTVEDSIKKRMANIKSKEEELEVNALIKRAFNPECAFDRNHTLELTALAIMPHTVSWHFKLRERIHRLTRH